MNKISQYILIMFGLMFAGNAYAYSFTVSPNPVQYDETFTVSASADDGLQFIGAFMPNGQAELSFYTTLDSVDNYTDTFLNTFNIDWEDSGNYGEWRFVVWDIEPSCVTPDTNDYANCTDDETVLIDYIVTVTEASSSGGGLPTGIQGLVDIASTTFSDVTGLTLGSMLGYFSEHFVKVFLGSVLALLIEFKGWIILFAILSFSVFWIKTWLNYRPK